MKQNFMISVPEALKLVITEAPVPNRIKTVRLENATGYTLAKDIISPIDMPPYPQSAMDGYAVHLHDKETYKIVGEIKAGDSYHPTLASGQAVRIFTGAPVPLSANSVVMQEKTEVSDDELFLTDIALNNENIRPQGEQIKEHEVALEKNTKLTPAAIGFLAGLGIEEVTVYHKPSIAIVTTGNELVDAGQPLSYGQIYESNGSMLKSASLAVGYEDVNLYRIKDEYKATKELIDQVISQNDVVLLTGGISVGEYDFVGKALQENGVEQIFYKVRQKPGKPLFFGKKDDKVIFALPGNPAAALSCFYIYVHQTLEYVSGNKSFGLRRLQKKALTSFRKKGDRALFLKALVQEDGVMILEGQSSAMLHTFSTANALVFLSEDAGDIDVGDSIEAILLPL